MSILRIKELEAQLERRDARINELEVMLMPTCKGSHCNAVNGVGHSSECIEEHNKTIGSE